MLSEAAEAAEDNSEDALLSVQCSEEQKSYFQLTSWFVISFVGKSNFLSLQLQDQLISL